MRKRKFNDGTTLGEESRKPARSEGVLLRRGMCGLGLSLRPLYYMSSAQLPPHKSRGLPQPSFFTKRPSPRRLPRRSVTTVLDEYMQLTVR